ncbi:hypothetical protein SYNTR_0964 [Candidatus Syntrophocurvum alkaliphilum]|uniref:Uncharacterized protein n=1 Tax=Candidatus Syntrophocurvum alkaliphilum TaxID=2293317 RepID=A0A6I6DEG7_9FIRM|nr:hypothetical protein [Candidatus Syntrophocurvum alkaliphilum]QGT99557.1 hypothetical protein SYNTR_0964 [Candidatus Syntrophocurvum alkaliphilum]
MIQNEQKLMKLYDETASMIARIYYKGAIQEEEMIFLLNILEIIIQKDNVEIIDVLKKWWHTDLDDETNEIIKSTLLSTDFRDKESYSINIQIIKELIEK